VNDSHGNQNDDFHGGLKENFILEVKIARLLMYFISISQISSYFTYRYHPVLPEYHMSNLETTARED